MSLVTEDGSGLSTAESYVSIADANTYALARGLTFAIDGDDAALAEQALRRATTWLDATYRARFPGYRVDGRSQALEWPRHNAFDVEDNSILSTEIPIEIINATIEAAVREKASSGSLSPDVTPGQIRSGVKVVGAVEVTYASTPVTVGSQRPVATVVDDILSSLLGPRSTGLSGKAVRA